MERRSRRPQGFVAGLLACRMRTFVVLAGVVVLVVLAISRTSTPPRQKILRPHPSRAPPQAPGFAVPSAAAAAPSPFPAANLQQPGALAAYQPAVAPAPTAQVPSLAAQPPMQQQQQQQQQQPMAPAPAPAAPAPGMDLPGVALFAKLQANRRIPFDQRLDRAKQGLSHECAARVELARTRTRTKDGHKYYSQFFQDAFFHLNFYFDNPRDGFFLDVGANEPVLGSNSYFFEKCLGWRGLMFEGMPSYITKLKKSRKMDLVPKCALDHDTSMEMISSGVCSYIGEANQLQKSRAGSGKKSTVQCGKIGDELRARGIKHIDIMSLDIEGSEVWALEGIYWDEVQIDFIVAENNFGDEYVRHFLFPRGYVQIAQLWPDEVFMYVGHIPLILRGGNDIYLDGAAEHSAANHIKFAHKVDVPPPTHSDTHAKRRQERRRKHGIKPTHGNM